MEKTSQKLKREKLLFFAKRSLIYGSFVPFVLLGAESIQYYAIGRIYWGLIYCLYLMGMFYLVGKELDHRLKIYFRTNSSVDRMFYRFLSGYLVSGLFAYIFSFLPSTMQLYAFWIYWLAWGLLYCWPTRAKILKEPFLKQVSEFRYLDKFEKLLVFLCIAIVAISIPVFQETTSTDIFIAVRDAKGVLHQDFWKSMNFLFQPAKNLGAMQTTSWFMFLYFFSNFTLLVGSYGILRFFFNRRLSLLGIFSIATSWTLVLTFETRPVYGSFTSSFALLWIWSLMWSLRSATYRSGLFVGLMGAYGYIMNVGNFPFYFLGLALGWFILFKEKTNWYRKQFLKYNLLGALCLAFLVLVDRRSFTSFFDFKGADLAYQWTYNFFHKDFYILSILGAALIIMFLFNIKNITRLFKIYNGELFEKFLYCMLGLTIVSVVMSPQNLSYSNTLWMMSLLSLVPLEWLFQAIKRLRSKSNLIYGVYIVICLLDSRIEGRIKNLVKFLDL